jgi:rod shape-determining protein MreB and related proteins
MRRFFVRTLYIKVSPDLLSVHDPETGAAISDVPEIALSRGPGHEVVAVGRDARRHAADPSVRVLNPFAHPRSMVSDFTAGERLLKAFLSRIKGRSLFSRSPVVVLHPLGEHEGGLTAIEVRAFREMALGAGAVKVTIWQGRSLADHELLTGHFEAGGKVLE